MFGSLEPPASTPAPPTVCQGSLFSCSTCLVTSPDEPNHILKSSGIMQIIYVELYDPYINLLGLIRIMFSAGLFHMGALGVIDLFHSLML